LENRYSGTPKQAIENWAGRSVNLDHRIAARYPFEVRMMIRLQQRQQNFAVHGWTRDLSETGVSAFVAEQLWIGESVTLQIPLGSFGKAEIAAKVARETGTQYGFQFTALSAEQRFGIQIQLKGHAIPHSKAGK
jgi:hypothetical protein